MKASFCHITYRPAMWIHIAFAAAAALAAASADPHTNASSAAASAHNGTTDGFGGRRLNAGRGRGRGGGRGGRGRVQGGGESDVPLWLPSEKAPPNERVCYPLPNPSTVPKQGQVLEGTSFGAALSAIASLPNVKRVLELGTWYGGGSTVNLARGVRDTAAATLARSLGASAPSDNCIERTSPSHGATTERCCHSLVVTLEVFEPAWSHARKYLRDWPVWCVRGSTVDASEMLQPHDIPMNLRDAHFKLYYQRDLALMRKSTPMVHRFCAAYQFELVLIDGNEYTGWAEVRTQAARARPPCSGGRVHGEVERGWKRGRAVYGGSGRGQRTAQRMQASVRHTRGAGDVAGGAS